MRTECSRWGPKKCKGKNKHRKFKEQPAGQWGWSPGSMDQGKAVRRGQCCALQGLPRRPWQGVWEEFCTQCSGRAAEGKSLHQESDMAQFEFLTSWPLWEEHISQGVTSTRQVRKPLQCMRGSRKRAAGERSACTKAGRTLDSTLTSPLPVLICLSYNSC